MYGAFKDVQKVNCKKKSWRKSDCGWLCFWTKITSIGFVTFLGQIDPLEAGYMPKVAPSATAKSPERRRAKLASTPIVVGIISQILRGIKDTDIINVFYDYRVPRII